MALVQDTVKHPAMCAQRLAVEALARGGGDNVAVAVVFLPGHGTTGGRCVAWQFASCAPRL